MALSLSFEPMTQTRPVIIALAGHIVEVDPALRILRGDIALCAQHHAVFRGVLQLLQNALDLLGRELLVRLHAPADEDLVRVVAMVMVMMMVVLVLVVILIVMMVVAGALRVVALVVIVVVMMMVMMLVLILVVVMVMMVLMLILVLIVVMVVAGAVRIVALVVVIVVMVMVLVRLFFEFLELHRDGRFLLHGGHQLLAGQLVPRGRDEHGVGVVVADELDALVELLLRNILRARENDRVGGFDLVIVEFAEVLHIHLALRRVGHGHEASERHIVGCDLAHRADHVRELADT